MQVVGNGLFVLAALLKVVIDPAQRYILTFKLRVGIQYSQFLFKSQHIAPPVCGCKVQVPHYTTLPADFFTALWAEPVGFFYNLVPAIRTVFKLAFFSCRIGFRNGRIASITLIHKLIQRIRLLPMVRDIKDGHPVLARSILEVINPLHNG
ncbi:hypothetical protein D3C71_1717080 [compost metagenome]